MLKVLGLVVVCALAASSLSHNQRYGEQKFCFITNKQDVTASLFTPSISRGVQRSVSASLESALLSFPGVLFRLSCRALYCFQVAYAVCRQAHIRLPKWVCTFDCADLHDALLFSGV